MHRSLLAGLALLLPAVSVAAPTPVVLDDFYRIAVVAGPDFAPDGSKIAYGVTINERKTDAAQSDLWVVPWSGGAPVQLTRTPESSEWKPRYTPDGRTLVFLSDADARAKKKPGQDPDDKKEDEDEETQLWRMPATGGQPARITAIVGGIDDFALSPDGTRAVVVAEVGKTVGSKAKTPPPIETERFFFKQDGRGYLDDRAIQLFIVDLATGKATQLTQGAADHWMPSWSPDGKWIAYTGKGHTDAEDRTLDHDVYVIAASGGVPRKISDMQGMNSLPEWSSPATWSPDSRHLVWLEAKEGKWLYYGNAQLAVADLATGTITRPARIDRWFYQPRWTADGKLTALIEQDRDTWLAQIDPDSGAIDYLTRGARFAYDYAISANGRIAVLDATPTMPPELRGLSDDRAVIAHNPQLKGQVAVAREAFDRTLTEHNAWLKDRALGETRDIAFKSKDGTEIHGYLTLPPGADPAKRYPLIASLHGGPVYQHSHEFDLDVRLYNAAGYAVLSANPRGSSGRGFEFSKAIYADWGHLDAEDISAGISHAIDSGVADPARIAVGGWSYGGILTDYMIASDPRIKAAVSGAGTANVLAFYGVDMYAREYLAELGAPWENFDTWKKLAFPFLQPGKITAPTLFECAGADDNVPCPGAQQMYQMFKTRGLPTKLIVYPGENHGLVVPSYLVHRMRSNIGWYDRWLKPAR